MSIYSFKEKRRHFEELLAEQHLESDMSLLNKLQPNATSRFGHLTGNKLAKEVLYLLLDFAKRDEIVANRRSAGKDGSSLIVQVKDLTLSILGKTKEEALVLKEQAEGLIVRLPEEDASLLQESLKAVMSTIKDGEGLDNNENPEAKEQKDTPLVVEQTQNADDAVNGKGDDNVKIADAKGEAPEDNIEIVEPTPNVDDAVNGEGDAAPEPVLEEVKEPSSETPKAVNDQKKNTPKKPNTLK